MHGAYNWIAFVHARQPRTYILSTQTLFK